MSFDKYLDTITIEEMKDFIWNSTEAIEDYICVMNGWTNNKGKHGTDAYNGSQAIEIKTQSFTGTTQKISPLNGKFTFSQPSLETVERCVNEEIHIFGKDDLTREIVYHISISGEEFAPYLRDHVESKLKNQSASSTAPTMSWNYNSYKDFKSLKIHSFNREHLNAHHDRWSSEFAKFLIGDIAYYEQFFKGELSGFTVIGVDKVQKSKKKAVTVLTIVDDIYGVKTTRTLSTIKKWNPKKAFIEECVSEFLENPVIDVAATYALIEKRVLEVCGDTNGLLKEKSLRSKISKMKKYKNKEYQ